MTKTAMQDALRLSVDKKRRIVENRRQLLLNLEQLLRKQNMVCAPLTTAMAPALLCPATREIHVSLTLLLNALLPVIQPFTESAHLDHGLWQEALNPGLT